MLPQSIFSTPYCTKQLNSQKYQASTLQKPTAIRMQDKKKGISPLTCYTEWRSWLFVNSNTRQSTDMHGRTRHPSLSTLSMQKIEGNIGFLAAAGTKYPVSLCIYNSFLIDSSLRNYVYCPSRIGSPNISSFSNDGKAELDQSHSMVIGICHRS